MKGGMVEERGVWEMYIAQFKNTIFKKRIKNGVLVSLPET